jgi:glycolate oxidase
MAEAGELLAAVLGPGQVVTGAAIANDYGHDEALGLTPRLPAAVAYPQTTAEVARLVAVARQHAIPLTARGSGTGLSGACIPAAGGAVVSFERMSQVLEIDTANHVAVVQPGVSLAQLDAATAKVGLVYPVFPGESSASLGGNVATNAGGMRAVKYGVTRHQVLGLEAVLGTGEIIRTGGRFVKATAGYDLTQLITGSEGTLALVTEVTLRLYPRPDYRATVLAPFATLEEVTAAVPPIVASGIGPLMIEYLDQVTMASILATQQLDAGIPEEMQARALAFLVLVVEQRLDARLDEDVEELAALVAGLGALDVFVLPPHAGTRLIEGRERAFWNAKAAGADDIIDMVVPRAAMPAYMSQVAELARNSGSWVAGCGHAGDGNVHLSVFQSDPDCRDHLIHDLFAAGLALGGAISGEHGIGIGKKEHFVALEDPAKLALWRRIKGAFDPDNVLNPGTIFDS